MIRMVTMALGGEAWLNFMVGGGGAARGSSEGAERGGRARRAGAGQPGGMGSVARTRQAALGAGRPAARGNPRACCPAGRKRAVAGRRTLSLSRRRPRAAPALPRQGNEFGHPEWLDFPRDGNNWSYFYCRWGANAKVKRVLKSSTK
jgi:hypothetical protein